MKNKVIHLQDTDWQPGDLDRAIEALKKGEIVAFPTETVYGLGVCQGHAEAAERLNRIKRRLAHHPLTLHLSTDAEIGDHVKSPLTPLGTRLLNRFTPGPLTLILPALDGAGEVGIRIPRHSLCQALLKGVGGALLATSANFTGETSATDPGAFPEDLAAEIAMIVDAGPSRYKSASTVVRPEGDRPVFLREGAIPPQLILDVCGPVTLIVCTGNTCRSPMASIMLKDMLSQRYTKDFQRKGLPIPEVRSAGTGAASGIPATRNAILAMKGRGLDLGGHVSTRLTPALVKESDFILTMSKWAARRIVELDPESEDRIAVLNESGGGIHDPVGGPLEEYRSCSEILQEALDDFLDLHEARFCK